MPEGDTIHHAARRVGSALVDREIEAIETHEVVQFDDNRTTCWCPACQV